MSKLAKWAIIAFLAFYLFTNPGGAAGTAHHLLNGLHEAAASLSTFVSNL
jgi:hypothetical protein